MTIPNLNHVGYGSANLRMGFNGTGGNFINVGGTTELHIGDLKVVGYDDACLDTIYAQKLNNFGGTDNGKIWVWADIDDEDEGLHLHGWYDTDGDEPVNVDKDVVIGLGEGLWIDRQSDEFPFAIQNAGQVYGEALPIELRKGFSLIANPCPCDLTIGSVVITGYDDACLDCIYAQKLNSFGGTENGKIWVWADIDDEDEGLHLHGWYDTDGDEPVYVGNTIPLAMGESLWIDCQDDSFTYYVNFPTALEN